MKKTLTKNTGGNYEEFQPSIIRCYTEVCTRWSILPAFTVHGYLDHTLIMQGSVDSETLKYFPPLAKAS